MANEEHLEVLKKGVGRWNEWRKHNPDIVPVLEKADLSGADLSGANLNGAALRHANLNGANLIGATLIGANLREANLNLANLSSATVASADLSYANLSEAILSEANLNSATLNSATLNSANLSRADLGEANLRDADLSSANLFEADVMLAKLIEANLFKADFKNSWVGFTTVANIDLSTVKDLETVRHTGPSTIGIDTIYRSKGKIPEVFLRGAGVPEPFIVQIKALVAAMEPIQFYSCFISYSSKDHEFAERLYADLQAKNVRCWFAPEEMKIGDRIRPRIDEAIRVHDKLLLVLSESSVKSTWVEAEVEAALERERKQERAVLFPIRLDDAVKEAEAKQAWAAHIRRTQHIGDFRGWKDHDKYMKSFERLMRDLKAGDEASASTEE
jgi:hypothetical protein